DDGIEARTAQAIVHRSRRLHRQAGEQYRMPRNVAAVLAGLAGATDGHIIDRLRREARASHHLLDHAGEQVAGPHARQRAAMAAKGRAQAVVNVGVEHGVWSPGDPSLASRVQSCRTWAPATARSAAPI